MSPLLHHPLWTADTLGSPLPDNDFGVSVSLPLWAHVIGYEEGDERVTSQFRSGYPRFFLPPLIERVFRDAERRFAREGERCVVFPRRVHAERCLTFIANAGRLEPLGFEQLTAVVVPADKYDDARRYWRFAGEILSCRQSACALGERPAPDAAQSRAATHILRERLAGHAGQHAEDVFLFPSGMAASFAAQRMLTAVFPGRQTVQFGFPYVDVLKIQQLFGTGCVFVPTFSEEGYAQIAEAAKQPLAGLYSEAPTNPLLQCADFARLREMLPGVPFIIDDTVGTSIHLEVARHADVILTSLTKTFSGAGDVLAGSLILNRASPHYAAFSAFLRDHHDHELFGDDAITLELNSRSFADRAQAMGRNSLALATHLRSHPAVAHVWHPAWEGGAGYRALQRADGHGCLFSFVLKDVTRTPAFYDALQVCKGPSLGTDFTLVCPYTLLAHYQELDWAESCGVPRHLIRVSAGIEDSTDLIARFDRALAQS